MKRFASLLIAVLCSLTSAYAGTANLPSAKVLLLATGAPSNGTDEVQTLTFGGTPTGGTFALRFNNSTTPAITWSATNGTLVSNIDSTLESLSIVGAGGVTTAVGTMTAGIGTITVTFTGKNGRADVPQMTVANNSMTGSAPTLVVSTTTPGVFADGRSSAIGTLLFAAASGAFYYNTTAPPNVTWTPVP